MEKYNYFNRQRNSRFSYITIRNNRYPVTIEGKGEMPCLAFGTGTLLQKTLSDNFKDHFTVYSTDTYWAANNKIENSKKITIQDIVDDTLSSAQQLFGNQPYILLGFSCFGILAIEAAKKKPKHLAGVMAVSTPPRWDAIGIKEAERYFEKNASQERKNNHEKRQMYFKKIRHSNESIVSVNHYISDAAKYFYDYAIADELVKALWQGVKADDDIMNRFFTELLPNFCLADNIETIEIPIIMLAGEHDYDSAPLLLWKNYPKPKNFTIVDCGNTGHWPQYENSDFFDKSVTDWYRNTQVI